MAGIEGIGFSKIAAEGAFSPTENWGEPRRQARIAPPREWE